MAQDKPGKKVKSTPPAAAPNDPAAVGGLANDFLNLWQENLLAWASDPALSPSLPLSPSLLKGPPDDK